MKKINNEEPKTTEEKKIPLNESIQFGEFLVINDSRNDSIISDNNQSFIQEKKKKSKNINFSLIFLVIIIILAILLVIYYINFCKTNDPNFIIFQRNWKTLVLNDRKYENYLFDNGLEVMLIYDKDFDRDGGAIVIEKGYYDNPYEEGISTFASYLLSILNFNETDNIPILEDYFGNFKYETNEDFINFRFDILNNGFNKFLDDFSQILNFKNINEALFDYAKKKVITKMQSDLNTGKRNIVTREKHLIEYLVYGFKNESNGDILPEGNPDIINMINISFISDYIKNFINPSKMKIVLFSKYKFLISSKYMKYYFKYLTNLPKFSGINNNNINNINKNKIFNTSQIFYIKANDYELNYLKIIYYVNKIGNEDYSELNYKQRNLYYIRDFIEKRKNGSLYSLFKSNIKSIEIEDFEVKLKSVIKFSIKFELNSLENINDLIYGIYQYMYKIISEINEKDIQIERYNELYEICYKNQILTEKSYNTIELAYANAEHLKITQYNQKDYFFWYCLPSYNENNKSKYFDEMKPYFNQLRPNNSVIILAIRDKDKHKLTCNNVSKFYLNCSYFKDDSNIKNTSYYNVHYINDVFNSTLIDEYLKKDKDKDNFNTTFEKNKFKSKYGYPSNITEEENNIIKINYKNTLNGFYFKRNINFRVQKVIIKFNLYHPYLRQNNNTNENEKKCNYFLIMEMFSAIKRKINEELYEAILAKSQIKFEQSENHLDILVFCFSDQAYNISKIIKNIIYNTNWTLSDFFNNNEIYKNEAFDDFFIFDKNNIKEISRFYFNCELKNNLYNIYEFFPDDFEKNNCEECINNAKKKSNILKDLTTFIIDIYIYGFYTENEAIKIYDLFNLNNIYDFSELLYKININITADNYTNWTKDIIDLDKSVHKEKNVFINQNIHNKNVDGNKGISFRFFSDELSLNISIFQTIIERLRKNSSFLISYEMFKYRDFIFELIFEDDKNDSIIPNENLVIKEWNELLKNYEDLIHSVDKIGNRLYYLIKNFILTLDKKQTSLYEKGLSEINEYDYNGTVINPYKIIYEYNNTYKNGKKFDKNNLKHLIEYYNKTINNTVRINIFTKGK